MKYYIYSDLFLDIHNIDLTFLNDHIDDNCIIAGNMCNFDNLEKFEYYLSSFCKKFNKVFIVNGLYEYDSQILNIEDCKNICIYFEKCFNNLKFLNDSYIIDNGTLIFGTTLWNEDSPFNEKSKFFIQNALSRSIIDNYKIIIITNLPPSKTYCYNNEYNSKYLFYNNLDYYFKYNNLFDYWIYGSTQKNINQKINNTILISNQYIINNKFIDINVYIEL